MTTMDPPTVWGAMPTATDVRKAIMTDRTVAVTAIIAAAVVIIAMFAMVGVVAATGGDVTILAGALGTILGAITLGVANLIRARRTGPEE